MKKKNLIILLLIPFIISLLGIVSINVTFNLIENDIVGIKWDYKEQEGFQVDKKVELKAVGVSDSKYPVSMGNQLKWTVKNKDPNDTEVHAEIIKEGNNYYLKTISAGEVIVTCSNEKGNIFKTMNIIIFTDGVILLTPKLKSSQNNIDSNIYYGEYDLKNNQKVKASFEYEVTTQPKDLLNGVVVKEQSNNISFDLSTGKVKVKEAGDAYVVLAHDDGRINDARFDFKIVENGVNVYSYEDLLNCTNKSKEGEIVVLRKSFESVANKALLNDSSIEIFGNYDSNKKKFSFDNEIYRFETTYSQEYINQWNEFAKNNSKLYKPVSNIVKSGLRIQKDFYGNGYTLNFHNLAYPSLISEPDGYAVATLSPDDLFRGPLPFYTLGDPNNMPLITTFGQDNSGMYIDGNNITINDVNVKNCDPGNLAYNMTYVGNVMDINGDNVTIKNSRLSNGKNLLRSFSNDNVVVDNCLFTRSRNFAITTGSNEYVKIDDNKMAEFTLLDGSVVNDTVKNFLALKGVGDDIVTKYISGQYDSAEQIKGPLYKIDDALNDTSKVANIYKGSMNINDCFFYQSGISAISLDTYFNGTYLYSKAPSLIGELFSQFSYEGDVTLVPYEPENVSGISYPVKVNISGNTRFYDYKDAATLDIGGLIDENISRWANTIVGDLGVENIRKITIDDIFPIKELLNTAAMNNNAITGGKFNVPIAYYGGGVNLSEVTYNGFSNTDMLTEPLDINLLDNYADIPSVDSSNLIAFMKPLMIKTVTTVTGYKPFRFVCTSNNSELLQDLLGSPDISILIENAKG